MSDQHSSFCMNGVSTIGNTNNSTESNNFSKPITPQTTLLEDNYVDSVDDEEHHEPLGGRSTHFSNASPSVKEVGHILFLAFPVQIMMVSQLLITTEAVIFTGHMDRDTLAGCSLANVFISVFGVLTGQGISTACDTLFSRAVGTSEKRRLMIYFHQSWQIMSVTFLFMLAVIPVLDRIMFACGYQAKVLLVAGEYLLIYSPAILIDYFFILLSRYLQCQDYVRVPALAAVAGNFIHIVLQLIVSKCDFLGFRAVAASQAISISSMFVIEFIYVHRKKMLCFSREDVKFAFGSSWSNFLRLAVPGFLVIVLENLCFRIASMITAFVGVNELDAQTVVNQIETLMYTVPASLGISVSIRVARSLGAGEVSMAQKSYKLAMVLGVGFAVLTILLLGFCGSTLTRVFTTDIQVLTLANQSIYVLLPMQLVDALSAVLCGVLRGCARHRTAALLIFIAFYVIALPVGSMLEYWAQWKMRGIWTGMICGLTFLSIFYFYLVYKTNWIEQAELAKESELLSQRKYINKCQSNSEADDGIEMRRLSTVSISSVMISMTPQVMFQAKRKLVAISVVLALFVVSIIIRCSTELPVDVTNANHTFDNRSSFNSHTLLISSLLTAQ